MLRSCAQAAGRVRPKIRGPKTKRLITGVNARPRVLRSPARRILKPANGADAPILAQREPVRGPARHAQHIARATFNRRDLLAKVQKENSAPGKSEPPLVLKVSMLLVE